MQEVAVIDNPVVATVALEPTRARVLAELVKPGSATTLAERLGLPRQQLNYHVRALEAQGLVALVEVRSRRGCTERVDAGFRGGVRALARRPRSGRGRPCPHRGQTLGRLPARPWRPGDPRGRRPAQERRRCGQDAADVVDRHRDPLPVRGRAGGLHPRPRRGGGHARQPATTTRARRAVAGRASSCWPTPARRRTRPARQHQPPRRRHDRRQPFDRARGGGAGNARGGLGGGGDRPRHRQLVRAHHGRGARGRRDGVAVRARRLDDGSGTGAGLGSAAPGRLRRGRRR